MVVANKRSGFETAGSERGAAARGGDIGKLLRMRPGQVRELLAPVVIECSTAKVLSPGRRSRRSAPTDNVLAQGYFCRFYAQDSKVAEK